MKQAVAKCVKSKKKHTVRLIEDDDMFRLENCEGSHPVVGESDSPPDPAVGGSDPPPEPDPEENHSVVGESDSPPNPVGEGSGPSPELENLNGHQHLGASSVELPRTVDDGRQVRSDELPDDHNNAR